MRQTRIANLCSWLLAGLILSVLLAGAVVAQVATASLSGVVADQSGAVVPTIDITATHLDTNRVFKAKTDEYGRYTLLTLPTGKYKITAGAAGFKTLEREAELTTGQAANLNLTMEVGQVTEVVDVTAQAPLVNATNSTVGTLIDSKQIFDLPLSARNFTQLITLTPGVSAIDTSQAGAGPAVQGRRNRDNLYLTDGAINSNLTQDQISISPPLDSIQEFRLESVHNDAEFGGASGAIVNLSTKAGTNRLHGTVYDYLRNDVLNARNTFQPTIPKFRNNQFGFSVGGPIYIPKLYAQKDKTWFFLSYEGIKNRATSSSITRVATEAERNGDFSVVVPGIAASNTPIYDPFTTRADPAKPGAFLRDPFPDRKIPSSQINPIAAKYLDMFSPRPNFQLSGTLNNYLVSGPSKSDSAIIVARGDHSFSERDRVFFRMTWSDATNLSQSISPVLASSITEGRNAAAEWNHNFGPATLLNVRYGFNRNKPVTGYSNLDQAWEFIKVANVSNPDAFPTFDPAVPLFPGYSISGYAGLVAVGHGINDSITHHGNINLHRFWGRHSFKAGYSMLLYDNYGGSISQTEVFGIQPTQSLASPAGTGQAMASFLTGVPSNATRPLGLPIGDQGGWMYGAYLSDTLRASKNLSINFGLRWDHAGNLKTRQRNFGSFDRWTGMWLLEGPINIPGALFQGPNVRRGFIDPDWNNFSPRVGLAYSLTRKIVIRSGYSMFYDMYAGWSQIAQGPRVSWPTSTFQDTGTINATVPSILIDRPFAGLPDRVDRPNPFPSAGFQVNRLFKTPYVHEWNLAIERQFTDDFVASVGYVGTVGRMLECCGLTNYATVLGPGPARDPSKVPYPNMLVFRTNDNNGTSDYHGLQLKAERRFSNGFSFLFSYTWSKSLDLACSGYIGAEGCNVQQPYNVQADRGPSAYDLTHISNIAFVYELPIGRGKPVNVANYFLNLAAGGWRASGILRFRSGQALTPILPVDRANNGGTQQRPDVIGDTGLASQDRLQWFNTKAFALPTQYTYGNAGRAILRGPAVASQDLSLFKDFHLIGESLKLQYRADLLNAFNHPTLGNPGTTFDTPAFGQINSASGNRTVQMALKVIF